MEPRRIRSFVDGVWEQDIVPQLVDYIRIPNKSPAFDKDWAKAGHMKRAVDLIAGWCKKRPIEGMPMEIHRIPGRTPVILLDCPGDGDDTTGDGDDTTGDGDDTTGDGDDTTGDGDDPAFLPAELQPIDTAGLPVFAGLEGEDSRKEDQSFIMGAAVQGVETTKTKAKVTYKLRKDDSEATLDADVVLVATGRKPYTDGLGLEALGVTMSPRGQVETDAHWSTNVKGIYAIGDCIDGPMLAHKAEDEGMAVAETIAGQAGHVNYGVIPGVIDTSPEVANVGQTAEQLKDAGHAYKVGKFSFMGNGRAKANFAAEGFVKILADANTDRILGAHIIGPMAGDLIHEIAVGMEFGAAAEDIARTCHAHPTYSEAVREAALACGDGPIHS